MKHGRIIVEGLTDGYFVHQLICKRFAADFKPVYDNKDKTDFRYPVEKDDPDEVFRFVSMRKPENTLEICLTGGSSKEDVLKGLLRDESGDDRAFSTCIVFDADYPATAEKDATGNGGYETATKTFGPYVPEGRLFLFPNNQDNGTLETLLCSIFNSQNVAYFETCWPTFSASLGTATPKPQRPLSAKTELADYVEAYGSKISERKCYLRNLKNDNLWDYESPELAPLVEFLESFFNEIKA